MPKMFLALAAVSLAGYALPQTPSASTATRPDNSYGGLVPKPTRAEGARSKPVFTSSADVYSGISGPGQPVIGDGSGGYRSGNAGVMYKGPDPKPGWKTDWGNRANGAAYKAGLLPHIKPIWDLHLRDTIITLAEDGNWCDCVFGNDDSSSWLEKPGIVKIDFAADGTIVVSKNQPDFVLVDPVGKAAN